MATFELRNAVERNARLLKKVSCEITNLGSGGSGTTYVATDHRSTETVDGSIPAGAVAYKITNLGDGTGTNLASFTFNGDTIPATIQYISGSVNPGDSYAELPYVVNGNDLFVEYTTLA